MVAQFVAVLSRHALLHAFDVDVHELFDAPATQAHDVVVMLTFGASEFSYGNGFMAVYVAGVVMGNSKFIYQHGIGRFHDGIGWLMQVMLFGMLGDWLSNAIADEQIRSLVVDGVVGGVGSVMSFVPLIVILYFFISLLEDTGYMARAAFLIDRVMRAMGLHGKSFIPMILGFGCTVPGIMAARTLDNEKDRLVTIFAAPFMSCGARLPVYTLLIAAFFGASGNGGTVLFGIYLLGIIVAILVAVVLRHTIFKGEKEPFVMELPPYHIPTVKDVLMHMWEKAKDFLHRAFTIIFAATIIIWFLQSYDFSFHAVSDASASMLAIIGEKIAWIFEPLGFADWRASSALITGITAKESVVSTLSILTGASTDAGLSSVLQTMFTPLSAFAFLCFTVLYMPCVAAFAATKRELGTLKEALFAVLFQTGVAYIVALIIYQAGSVFL